MSGVKEQHSRCVTVRSDTKCRKESILLPMTSPVTVTVLPGEEENTQLIREKAAQALSVKPNAITALVFRKKSVDARRGQVKLHLAYTAYIGEEPPASDAPGSFAPGSVAPGSFAPAWKTVEKTASDNSTSKDVVVVGSGPAGLFAALRLLEHGLRPVILERGRPTADRKRDIALITRTGAVDGDSNYCFGEGGAGTFSDGKLYTRSNKRGDIGRILSIFAYHGADRSILTDAHPHIGTDRLPGVINRMRETIESHGGELRFGAACVGFETAGGRVTGVRVRQKATPAESTAPAEAGAPGAGEEYTLPATAVILATGHSARDVYELLARLEREGATGGKPLIEAKGFAIGVRVEHPRELIDRIQYHGNKAAQAMGAAEYRLTAQVDGRGVYSFCMCPGGFIVPSATADDEIVVNGMSTSGRNTRWSNAAIVVETRTEDIPERFAANTSADTSADTSATDTSAADVSAADTSAALCGVRYQKWLEQEAKKHGKGQAAPAQRLTDFIERKDSASLPDCSYTPGIVPSRLDQWLPPAIADRLREGFRSFDRFMHGFITKDAVLVAIETRTSSPVRVLRNKTTMESEALAGLFPAGEGSGYAGGIVSSAMDGENAADKVAEKLGQRK